MKDNKAENRRRVNISEATMGIDIGKHYHVAIAQNWDGRRLKPLIMENNLNGFNRLIEAKGKAQEYFGVAHVRFALEPTGQYWLALAEWLERRNEEVRLVQPAHTHKAKELEDNSPGKHDIKDGGLVADLDRQGESLRLIRPQGVFAELRHLTSCRQGLIQDINREINRLHGVMDLLFPELIGLFKNHIGKGLLGLLQEAACPDKIGQLGEEVIGELLKKKTKGKLGVVRASLIVQAARVSIGIKEGRQVLELELKQLLDRLEFIRQQLKEVERSMKVALKKVPDIEILLSIPAIGEISLAAILGEIGDIRHYHSAREIIKLAGLNLYEISSGQHHGVKRISKRGRPLLRQMLYMASLRLIRAKGGFNDFYQRLIGKGKHKIPAIVAVMCKLVRVLFAMARDKQKYNDNKVGREYSCNNERNRVELALN
jgi:transposase